jgi:transcriptional regulator with XRE-family HTH domain
MSENIRKRRESAGLTRPQLAERVGTSVSQIVKLERGERRLTVDWMNRIGKALGVSPASLMDGTAEKGVVPVIGSVRANGRVELRDLDLPIQVSRDRQLGPVQSCLEVVEEGFGPLIPVGSVLYISSIEVQDAAQYEGAPCAVWAPGGEMLVGRLIRGGHLPARCTVMFPNGGVLEVAAEALSPLSGYEPGDGHIGAYPVAPT